MKKQPKQKRSMAIVESILEASTRVLTQSKLSQMTTNKVAEIAGVSIGSLYDYFPNKNSILVTLMDKKMQSQLQDFYGALEKENTLEGLMVLVTNIIEREHISKKDFLRELFLLAPENGRMEVLYMNRLKAQEALQKFFIEKINWSQHYAHKKSFVVINAILGVLESYVVLEDIKVTEHEIKAEIVNLMKQILTPEQT
jgi:AcrR family transcriptional regulator